MAVKKFWKLAVYKTDRLLGGHEEGGWYYNAGERLKEGKIKLTLINNGNLEHNLVLINNDNYENLELTDDSSMADETKLDILGKISGLQPGESGELMLENVNPGTYAFICNTPGHYQLGMVNKIIVE